MGGQPKGTSVAEVGGRILAGALSWLLVALGVLGIALSVLRVLGETAPVSPAGTAVAVGVSLAVIAGGLYGNPRLRERLHATIG